MGRPRPPAPAAESVAIAEPPTEPTAAETSPEDATKDAEASDKTPEQQPAEPEPPPSPRWGYLNVEGDYLIGGAEPLLAAVAKDNQPAKGTNENFTASKRLVVMNRHSGEVLWTATATHYFRHNAICAGGGRLYAVDLLTEGQRKRLKRRGEEPTGGSRVVAWDMTTGSLVWECTDAAFGTLMHTRSRPCAMMACMIRQMFSGTV